MDVFAEGIEGLLMKVGVFALIQVLVYLILSASSGIFSVEKSRNRLRNSFRAPRSASIRRIVGLLSGEPSEYEPSPASPPAPMPAIPEDDS
ncbi:unnamed protein product [Spirodela intermedia]|uniref:Uncharacterized protein n=1 Tax=Spirodela intermedia TaxID=51605 RepID=A0A7I8KUV9_SPIIN|nr:unnamed protein product [Spirodela intermedia]